VVLALRVRTQGAVPLQPPPLHPAKVEFAPIAAISVIGVPVAKLAEQVAPHVMPDGELVTVPAPPPASAIDSVLVGISAKVAVTVVAPDRVTTHGAVPLHKPPDQPAKLDPLPADAVRVTMLPLLKMDEHWLLVGLQVIPAGLLVT
jgi:hypothetical protein